MSDDHGCSEASPCRNAALRWVHTSYCQILTLSADRKALREHVREVEDQRRALGDIAMQTKAQWDCQIAMTVARLGGEVEGAPTHAGNFLQRIDELRKIEEALRVAESDLRCIRMDLSDMTQASRVQRVMDRLRAALAPRSERATSERSERREGEPEEKRYCRCGWPRKCYDASNPGELCPRCLRSHKPSDRPYGELIRPADPKEEDHG